MATRDRMTYPPRNRDYDLLCYPDMPLLDELKPFLTDRGKHVLYELPFEEKVKVEKWWRRVRKLFSGWE